MEKKWTEILSTTGWKEYAYNKKEERLYLTSYLSKIIDIIENVTADDFKSWELAVKSHDKDKIEHWIKSKELANDMPPGGAANFLTKEGSYNIPYEYLTEHDKHIVVEAIKRNNFKQYKQMKFLDKRKFIKEEIKKIEALMN